MKEDTATVRSNYALRLQAALKTEAEEVARSEGTTLNQFINVAVAEKLSALRTASYFSERSTRGDAKKALAVLARLGEPGFVREGDEVSPSEPPLAE